MAGVVRGHFLNALSLATDKMIMERLSFPVTMFQCQATSVVGDRGQL